MREKMDQIRRIGADVVSDAVKKLFIQANCSLGEDVKCALSCARGRERKSIAQNVLRVLEENLETARRLDVPICQDTGMAVLFVEIGSLVHIEGATLEDAVNSGVSAAYSEGGLRCSVVRDPLYFRENTGDNTPAVLHIKTVAGSSLRMIAAPKGFGSENMSALRMMTPASGENDIITFVTDAVRQAGANPCPPITVGVGIGSDFEGVALLAKRALLRRMDEENRIPEYAALEKKLLAAVNALGIGPQGFGGDTTALAVHVEVGPTHIAGLPVAVNINCHVARHAECIL